MELGETLGGGTSGQVGVYFVNRTACLMLTNPENPHDARARDWYCYSSSVICSGQKAPPVIHAVLQATLLGLRRAIHYTSAIFFELTPKIP
jgi:hypothetical protein